MDEDLKSYVSLKWLHNNVDTYRFTMWVLLSLDQTFAGGLLVPKVIIHLEVSVSPVKLLIRYISC